MNGGKLTRKLIHWIETYFYDFIIAIIHKLTPEYHESSNNSCSLSLQMSFFFFSHTVIVDYCFAVY